MTVMWECPTCRTTYRVRLYRCPRCHGVEESMPKATRAGGASNAAAEREQEAAARPPANETTPPAEGGVVEDVPVVGEDGPPPVVLPERVHQLDGPSEGVEWPADGTMSPEIEGDGSGEALPPVEDDGVVPVAVDGPIAPLADEEAEQVEQIAAAHEGEGQRIVVLGEEESSPGSSSETSPEKQPTSPETSESALPKRAPKTGSRSKQGRTPSSTAGSAGSSTEADAASENE